MTEKRFTLKHIQEQHLSANLYDNKTFIASIGIGAELIVELLNNLSEDNIELKQENEQLKQQLSYYEKLITDKEVEWLRNNTVWEQMPSCKRTVTKTTFER